MQTKPKINIMIINHSWRLIWTIEKIHTYPLESLLQARNISPVSQTDLSNRVMC